MHGTVGAPQRLHRLHRIGEGARFLFKSEKVSTGCCDESCDARQETHSVGTMELKKTHQLQSAMHGRLRGCWGIHWRGGNRTCRRIGFATPTASASTGSPIGVRVEVMVESEKQGF